MTTFGAPVTPGDTVVDKRGCTHVTAGTHIGSAAGSDAQVRGAHRTIAITAVPALPGEDRDPRRGRTA